jgi:hypothetical protein
MTEPGDDDFSRAVAELGDPDAVFHVSRGRYQAKLWVGVGLILGTAAVLGLGWFVGLGLAALGFAGKLIFTPPVIGAVILVTMYRQRGLVVLVYPTGLLRLQRGAVESYPWDEVSEVRLKLQQADPPKTRYADDGTPTGCWFKAEVPSLMLWKAGLVVERDDGVEAHLGPALADYDALVREVQRRTFPRLWAAAWGKFCDGEPVAFGDLEVTATGLRHGGKRLPWRDFKEFTVSQGKLSVKKVGGWVPWLMLDTNKVPNLHVLYPLVEEAHRLRTDPAPAARPHAADPDHPGDA